MDRGLISDTLCVYCGTTGSVAWLKFGLSSEPESHLVCEACGGVNDIINGVPWFGVYMPDDFADLLSAFNDPAQASIVNAAEAAAITSICQRHHEHGAAATANDVKARGVVDLWYRDWFQLDAMLGAKSVAGAKVLVIGVGSAIEIARLLSSGAAVTCLETALQKLVAGRQAWPSVRWIGGALTNLPFCNEAFDYIVVNARRVALDAFPETFQEIVRVVKPDGELFILRLSTVTDAAKQGESVRSGAPSALVHQGRPRPVQSLGVVRDALEQAAANIHVALLVGPELAGSGRHLADSHADHWEAFDSDAFERLGAQRLSLGIAGRKTEGADLLPRRRSPYGLPPLTLAGCLSDPVDGLRRLLDWAPSICIDRPLLAETTWFDVLQGWGRVDEPSRSRSGRGQARWLLKRPEGAPFSLSIHVRGNQTAEREFTISLNGKTAAVAEIGGLWREFIVELPPAPYPGDVVMIELGWVRLSESPVADEFHVRDRRYGPSAIRGRSIAADTIASV